MIELLYRVVNLSQRGGTVQITLQEVRTIPPEEIKRARLAQEPETDVDDVGEQLHKVEFNPPPEDPMERMFWGMRRQFPEMAEAFKNTPRMGGEGRLMVAVPISNLVEMHISPEQYVEMGSPPLMAVLRFSLKLEPNP